MNDPVTGRPFVALKNKDLRLVIAQTQEIALLRSKLEKKQDALLAVTKLLGMRTPEYDPQACYPADSDYGKLQAAIRL